MRNTTLVAIALTLAVAAPLMAQVRPAPAAPDTWVTLYGQMYTGMNSFEDPDTDSRWEFEDNSFGLGAALMRQFGPSLLLGVDVSVARPEYETEPLGTTGEPTTGSSTVATALLLGRIAYGGVSDLGFYLTGGIGTIAYKLEAPFDSWNSDFALRAGTGLEYRFNPSGAVFLEWGRIWGYHEKEGVSGGRVSHSILKLGGRLGF
jgi:hypothetical protein